MAKLGSMMRGRYQPFGDRVLEATLRAQEIAATSESIDLLEVIVQSVGDAGSEQLHYDGPAYKVPSKMIGPMTMIFHELATNSVKYGALSVSDGQVHISWSLEPGSADRTRLKLQWREEGVPQVKKPERKGYGSS